MCKDSRSAESAFVRSSRGREQAHNISAAIRENAGPSKLSVYKMRALRGRLMTPRLLLQQVRRASLAKKFLFTVVLRPGLELARIFDWYRRVRGRGGPRFASGDRRALLSCR